MYVSLSSLKANKPPIKKIKDIKAFNKIFKIPSLELLIFLS